MRKIGYTKTIKETKMFLMKGSNFMPAVKVTINNFEEIRRSSKPVLLDFYAEWCGPCRMVSPIVDEIADENPRFLVGKINVDNNPELAQKFGVYLLSHLSGSTIGVKGLNFSVRNGKRWIPFAKNTF